MEAVFVTLSKGVYPKNKKFAPEKQILFFKRRAHLEGNWCIEKQTGIQGRRQCIHFPQVFQGSEC